VLTGRIRIKRIIMGFVEDGIGQFATCWETFVKSDWNSQLANDLSPFRLVMMSPPGRFKTRSLYKTGPLEGLKIQGGGLVIWWAYSAPPPLFLWLRSTKLGEGGDNPPLLAPCFLRPCILRAIDIRAARVQDLWPHNLQ
jgi:hypothetical protein